MTYTYAVITISQEAWDEIAALLAFAGYTAPFQEGDLIDMYGLALQKGPSIHLAQEGE